MFDQEKYIETFSQVHASEETLTEVLKMTKQNKNHYLVRVARVLVIAAVISAMLATTVFAYVGFTQYENPMQMLKQFFGTDEYTIIEGENYTYDYYGYIKEYHEPTVEWVPLDEKVAEEISPYVSAVGQSLTYDDYTLTVVAHLYDSATGCGVLNYTLENPDGIFGYELHSSGEIWWPAGEKISVSSFGESFIIQEETTDTKLSVAYFYDNVYSGNQLEVSFNPWIAYTPNEITDELAEEFDKEKTILYIPLNDGGGMVSVAIADGAIILSPISIVIDVRGMEFLRQTDTDGTLLPPRATQIDRLVIRYHDGTEYVVDSDEEGSFVMNYTYASMNSKAEEISYVFNRLIDVDSVETVIINGVEFTDLREATEAQRATSQTEQEDTTAADTEPVNP